MKKIRTIIFAWVLFTFLESLAFGSDIYITQNITGNNSGADCSNAHSVSWFNANATGGNTYHLCGTFTGTAGSTILTPPSGSAGNVVTVLFEAGAVLAAPYWGGANSGAITIESKSYVTIDGGTNGVIKNTANGTSLANRKTSQGIYISSGSHIEIKNLTIKDIYKNEGSSSSATDTAGVSTNNIYVVGNSNNLSIHNNILTAARTGIRIDFSTDENIDIYNNLISDHCWGIAVATSSGSPGDTATNTTIHNNEITDWTNWQCPANANYCNNKTDTYHTDGVILFAARGGPVFTPKVYNNYIHGDLGNGSATAFVFCTYGGGSSGTATSCTIYNNLLIGTNATRNPTLIWIGGSNNNTQIYNNTLVGGSNSAGTLIALSGTGGVIKNNIIQNGRVAVAATDRTLSTALSSSDHNVFYNINTTPGNSIFSQNDGAAWYTWAQWQAFGYDTNSSTSNPLLDTSFRISSTSSSALGRGANLSSVGIPSLNSDKAGIARPGSGPWDAGTYQSQLSAPKPQFPTIMGIGQ